MWLSRSAPSIGFRPTSRGADAMSGKPPRADGDRTDPDSISGPKSGLAGLSLVALVMLLALAAVAFVTFHR
ncbi:hypothetical protein BRC86_01500 [Halobacteriales archaeon QS_3_64_16]|nr:MAG: hypothetical protein BRC86_01500 [Halobacteriales archaeon QS_3_64_16]